MKTTLKSRLSTRLRRSRSQVFLRADFEDIGGYDQIGRILKELCQDGSLVKLGYGLYAKARPSLVTGKPVPELPLNELTKEALSKLNIKVSPSMAEQRYNAGESTQVPSGRVVAVKSRISRRIGFNGNYIKFERISLASTPK